MDMLQAMKAFSQAEQQVGQVKKLMDVVAKAQNPQAMLSQLAMSNPQIKQALEYIQNSGKNPKDAFYALAEEKGVNPEDILKQLM